MMKACKTILSLFCCLLLISSGTQQKSTVILPAPLSEKLAEDKKANDLTNWIYDQLDWITLSSATRSALYKEIRSTSWRQPVSNEELQAWLLLLLNEGHAMLLSGNIVASTDAYRNALTWVKEHEHVTTDDQLLEYILKPLGNNYTRLGDYEQALFIQQKALETALSLNNNDAVAGTYSNLAATCSSMGASAQSLLYCNEGLKVIKGNNAVKGLLLSERSEAYIRLKQTDSASISILESIKILEHERAAARGNNYWLFMAYQQAGDIFINESRKAAGYYNKALDLETQLIKEHGSIHQRERAKLTYRIGLLYQKAHLNDKAAEWFDKSIEQLIPGATFSTIGEKHLYGENTLVDVLFAQADLLIEERKTDDALRLFDLCFKAEKKLRREYITGASKERSVSESRARYETAIDAAYNAWQQSKRPVYQEQLLSFIESGKAQLLLEEVMQQQYLPQKTGNDSISNRIQLLEKALVFHQKNITAAKLADSTSNDDEAQQKQIEWELADLRKNSRINPMPAPGIADNETPFDYRKLIEGLRPNQSLRSFFTGTRAIYSIEITHSGIRFTGKQSITPLYPDTLYQFTQRYFQNGPDEMMNHPKRYYQEAYAIYHVLFGMHPLDSSSEYILLPDGILNSIPVDALVNKPDYPSSADQWPFIIKSTSVSYAYSLQTLKQQLVPAEGTKGFTGMFISENAKQDASLQSVLKEKKGIEQSVSSGTWLLNEQATSDAFYKALESSSVLHISSHAFAGKTTSVAPHIQLYDAPFYLFELKGIRQHPALAVLSACRTGDGRLISGEGVQSLARAFIANGTNAVIAGWWNVNDATTATLMSSFYSSLAADLSPAKALRDAKNKWLAGKNTPYLQKLPYYWAALNYQGAPDALPDSGWMRSPLRKSKTYLITGIIVISCLLLCSLLFWRRRQKWFSR